MSFRRKPVEPSMPSDTTPLSAMADGGQMQGGDNYISCFIGTAKGAGQPAVDWFNRLSSTPRTLLTAVMIPLMLIPLFWMVLLVPPVVFLVTIVYSTLFGFRTFVNHLEAALREHFSVSDSVSSIYFTVMIMLRA